MEQITSNREPDYVAAGDSINFVRRLPNYPSGQGWSITYEIRGGAAAIQFESTADPDGISHDVYVAPGVTAEWLPGSMVLAGYVGNDVDRVQVYWGELTVGKNLEGSQANIPVKTEKQIMLETVQAAMKNFISSGVLETRIGQTMVRYQSPKDLYFAYGMAYQARRNEIMLQRARAGRPNANKHYPRAAVTPYGSTLGQGIYPFSSNGV